MLTIVYIKTQESFKSLHLIACNWKARETIAPVVISSIWGSEAGLPRENPGSQTAAVLVTET